MRSAVIVAFGVRRLRSTRYRTCTTSGSCSISMIRVARELIFLKLRQERLPIIVRVHLVQKLWHVLRIFSISFRRLVTVYRIVETILGIMTRSIFKIVLVQILLLWLESIKVTWSICRCSSFTLNECLLHYHFILLRYEKSSANAGISGTNNNFSAR
jgi:hypothetical protein